MLKLGPKSIFTLVAVFTLCTCIDPYSPKLAGYTSLLSVDALITDANASYTVNLSKTFQNQDSTLLKVSDATVFITDDTGESSYLFNLGNGIYKTDSIEFRGSVGRTYVLHIITKNGEEFESDPCPMQSVPEIDTIYIGKDQEIYNNGTKIQDGVRIYLDSKAGDVDRYYRWAFEETWKFKVPTPKKYDYINDSTIIPVSDVKDYCWKNRRSDEILINSISEGRTGSINREPIFFIATDKSDRLILGYSILVKQYSISKKEYDFWNNLKQVNASGRDIFAKQPYTVTSNIHNIKNPKERVLGYFQVSAVKQKRKNIPFSEIVVLNLPSYHYPCKRIEMAPKDYPQSSYGPRLTWDGLYEMYSRTSGYYFVEPRYTPGTSELEKLVFAKPECANCEITGTRKKPDFWVE